MVSIFTNSDHIGTKFGTNQSHFTVNIVTIYLKHTRTPDLLLKCHCYSLDGASIFQSRLK